MNDQTHHLLSGETFTITLICDNNWCWEHTDQDDTLSDRAGFTTHADALADATKYAAEYVAQLAEDAAQEEEDRRYGTYEEQVRGYYYSTRL